MTVAIKNDNKTPLVVPVPCGGQRDSRARRSSKSRHPAASLPFFPKLPNANDEYTPEQRRTIDARLKEALEEVKQGHTAGPFITAEEMIASLKRELKQSRTKESKSRSR